MYSCVREGPRSVSQEFILAALTVKSVSDYIVVIKLAYLDIFTMRETILL